MTATTTRRRSGPKSNAQKCREYRQRRLEPDAALHNPAPDYVTKLVAAAKRRCDYTTQEQVAKRIGVSLTTLKDWKSGRVTMPYIGQYALERLAGSV